MICELQIKFFFCPCGILWYKFLSYIEVLCVLSEFSKLLELRFVSSSSETSRSSGTIQTSESSISSHPVFPNVSDNDPHQWYSHVEFSEPKPFCCECCTPPCLLCCDLCDPNQTKGMKPLDMPPKTSRR